MKTRFFTLWVTLLCLPMISWGQSPTYGGGDGTEATPYQISTAEHLKALVEGRGDTVTILKVEKRSKNLFYLIGGSDYRIEAEDNSGLCRYLKSRCYAVRMDTSLYVNCKKMRYKRYRFGGWYAPAMWVKGMIYFCAQPVGQVAASTATPHEATKLFC